mgnify:FL=1
MPSQGAVADTARADAGDLIIEVTGIESGRGAIQYALYDLEKYFPTRIGRIVKGEVLVQI